MALYVPNTNTTGTVVAVELHLLIEFDRKIDQDWGVIQDLVGCDADVPCMLLV